MHLYKQKVYEDKPVLHIVEAIWQIFAYIIFQTRCAQAVTEAQIMLDIFATNWRLLSRYSSI